MISTCIYCSEDRDMSKEHYLPRCLVNFKHYETLNKKLCISCNSLISKLEEQFCRSGIEALYRYNLDIKGRKSHDKISPFYRRSGGAEKIILKAKHPTENYDIFCEPIELFGSVIPARQIIVKDLNNNIYPILIDDTIKDEFDLKNKVIEKGVKEVISFEIFCKDYEVNFIKKLCSIFKDKKISIRDQFYSGNESLITANFNITDRYYRAIAKIAFHYFLKFFPSFSGFESEFYIIKKILF